MALAVWANSRSSPLQVCQNARLSEGGNLLYPAGNERGQAGWDVGLPFQGVADLMDKLSDLKVAKGAISRLAINSHGSPGSFDISSNGRDGPFLDFKTVFNRYFSPLHAIARTLSDEAVVVFMGCNVAKGEEGTKLLLRLSDIFKGRVVGFTTVGVSMRQYRRGANCTEPGMRDTEYEHPAATPQIEAERYKELLKIPWASESSPNAKVAKGGTIISGADPKAAPTDYNPLAYIPGTWSVSIGNWPGYFVFSKDGKCYWTEQTPRSRHPGKWWTMAGCIQWSFSDDAPGWQRTFEVLTPLKSTVNGKATINGQDHGFFTMSKQN